MHQWDVVEHVHVCSLVSAILEQATRYRCWVFVYLTVWFSWLFVSVISSYQEKNCCVKTYIFYTISLVSVFNLILNHKSFTFPSDIYLVIISQSYPLFSCIWHNSRCIRPVSAYLPGDISCLFQLIFFHQLNTCGIHARPLSGLIGVWFADTTAWIDIVLFCNTTARQKTVEAGDRVRNDCWPGCPSLVST